MANNARNKDSNKTKSQKVTRIMKEHQFHHTVYEKTQRHSLNLTG